MKNLKLFCGALLFIQSHLMFATVWNVGPTQTYTMPSALKYLVNDGDTIYIDGGVYSNDATKWIKNNLKFIGTGTPSNPTILQYAGDIPNGKGIWVFEQPGISDNPYIENITFDGAQVSDVDGGNGAGIRFQSVNLTIKNCKFINCQNGILEGGSYTGSNVIIENSEFSNNGYNGSNTSYVGYEHHIYISACTDTLIVKNSYFHNPRGEANSLKSRALRNYILYNLIDEATGNGSWELNIAQGGLFIVMGNVIIQGTSGANHGIIGWDAASNPIEELYFINNTVVNKFIGNNKFVFVSPSSGISVFKFYNNIFASTTGASNTLFAGNTPSTLDTSNNIMIYDYTSFGFVNAAANNFNLLSTAAPAIDNGISAGNASTGYILTPTFMYQNCTMPLLLRNIYGNIDIGAYEYDNSTVGNNEFDIKNKIILYPNPFNTYAVMEFEKNKNISKVNFSLCNILGQEVLIKAIVSDNKITIDRNNLLNGIYFYKLTENNKIIAIGKIIIE